MKKATVIFLWIAFAASIFGLLNNAVSCWSYWGEVEGFLVFMSIFYIVTNAITIWFSVSTIKVVNNATRKSDISTGRKVATFIIGAFCYVLLIPAILMCCLKDSHFGYVPATSTSTTAEDAYEKLTKLKELYESGAITEEEYIAEKAKILK